MEQLKFGKNNILAMPEFDNALHILKTHMKPIIIGMVIGAVVALSVTLLQTPRYRAEMIVAPTERTGVPSLSSFLPQAAADAPALQYFVERIDASQSTDFTVFETLITSPKIITQIPESLVEIGQDRKIKWFQTRLKMRPVGLTPFRKITFDYHDRDKLIPVLNTVYRLADQSIRHTKKAKTARRITYLEEQLSATRHPDHRDAIIALLKEQEQTAMMAEMDGDFAAMMIQPPYIITKPIAPNAMILYPILMVLGGFLGLIIGGVRQQ